jgi:hypothetical protein
MQAQQPCYGQLHGQLSRQQQQEQQEHEAWMASIRSKLQQV